MKTALILALSLLALPARAEVNFDAPPAETPTAPPAPAVEIPPVIQGQDIAPVTPVLIVNGAPISGYELAQREAFLKALQQPGDLKTQALQALVTDRLQEVAATRLGLSVSAEELRAGMAEFAARAKMSPEAFLAAVGQEGVAPETVRDFVRAGLLWRAATREKFAGRVEISEAEIDRAIGAGATSGSVRRLLMSELVIPNEPGRDAAALAERVRKAIRTEKDFAIMARQFSKATTAASGGELGWIDEDKLPPDVAGAVAGLHMGEMTAVVPNAVGVALYFLRDESAVAAEGGAAAVDYAVLSGGGSSALAAQVMGCDRLYAVARQAGGQLQRDTVALGAVPGGLGPVLAGMDAGEARVLPDGRLVMLCSRTTVSGAPSSRAAVRTDLVNAKAAMLADAWAEELRFDAFIETP